MNALTKLLPVFLCCVSTSVIAATSPENQVGIANEYGPSPALVAVNEIATPASGALPSSELILFFNQTDAYLASGEPGLALSLLQSDFTPGCRFDLEAASAFEDGDKDKCGIDATVKSHWHLRLGSTFRQLGQFEEALEYLSKSRQIAARRNNLSLETAADNEIGLTYLLFEQSAYAAKHFIQAYRTGKSHDNADAYQVVRVLLNLAHLVIDDVSLVRNAEVSEFFITLGQTPTEMTEHLLREIEEGLALLPEDIEKVQLLQGLAHLYRDYQNRHHGSGTNPRLKAHGLFQQSLGLLEHTKTSDSVGIASSPQYLNALLELRSLAWVGLALLYEDEERCAEARKLALNALSDGYKVGSRNSIYQGEWLLARCALDQGNLVNAQASMERAVDVFRDIRTTVINTNPNSYLDIIQPLFYQYADILLRLAKQTPEDSSFLYRVRDVLEEVRQAEVEDYFDNQCVAFDDPSSPPAVAGNTRVTATSNDRATEKPTGNIGVFYPVLFEDRIESLLVLPNSIVTHTERVGKNELTQLIREFRFQLEVNTGTLEYLRKSEQLYLWLLDPFEQALADHGVDTLVYVPDGPLRTVPLAALFDGRGFLVKRFAIATTPGFDLVNSTVAVESSPAVFAGGISEAVQGFSALPNVLKELEVVQTELQAETFRNSQFSLDKITTELASGEFTIAHFATHGEFNSDHRQSFLLTYDGKMTMTQLESVVMQSHRQGNPLDLLVLSACQTAAGDDRAALGLAGVAIQAGARSALASLWSIDDESSFHLVNYFYDQYQDKKQSKAESLRQAQIRLLADPKYKHPSHWAPFLMVGNWR